MFRRKPAANAEGAHTEDALPTAAHTADAPSTSASAGAHTGLHTHAGAACVNTAVQSAGSPCRPRAPAAAAPCSPLQHQATAAVATTGFAARMVPDCGDPELKWRAANGTLVGGRYLLERTIGSGSYGKVKLATDVLSLPGAAAHVAVKFIEKSSIRKQAHATRIHREINLLAALHHPGVVALRETLETPHDIVIVMEHVAGADLYERIVAHPQHRFDEQEGRALAEQIVAAVAYCHAHRVVHRDIKPENVVVTDGGEAKLIDFGFANVFHPRGLLETNCGSPLYAAPEIVQGVRYTGPGVDVWSLGVVLFAMLTGALPFEDQHLKGLYAKICAGAFELPAYLSPGACHLIRAMLTVDTRARIQMDDVMRHPWLAGARWSRPPLFAAVGSTRAHHAVCPAPAEHILRAMALLGFADVAALRLAVRTDPDDPATALYALLVEREARERNEALVAASHPSAAAPPPSYALATPPLPGGVSFAPRGGVASAPGARPAFSTPPPPLGAVAPPVPPPRAAYTPAPTREKRAAPSPHTPGEHAHSIFSSPGSIVSHAAATVASHFRKLRGIGGSSTPRSVHSGADRPVQPGADRSVHADAFWGSPAPKGERPASPHACDSDACNSFLHVA